MYKNTYLLSVLGAV